MTSSTGIPSTKPVTYRKPTWANTNGGTDYTPTHPGIFRVHLVPPSDAEDAETYSDYLVAEKAFDSNTPIATLTDWSDAEDKLYSTVQAGRRKHIHLNTDAMFINHSCKPSVDFFLPEDSEKWCIRTTDRALKAGDPVTFFYPSTEWEMEQPFKCTCQSDNCIGWIKGAKDLTMEQLTSRGYINEHIIKMKEEQTQKPSSDER